MSKMAERINEYSVGEAITRVSYRERAQILDGIESHGGVLMVFDRNTRPLFSPPHPDLVLPAGESSKEWASVEAILQAALSAGLGRDGTFVACGGGVVSDLTAFAASIYMRGCRVIIVPTTLLAMVDASFGGKTGIDFGGYKNIVGSFHPADELRIAVGLLTSLPEREFRCGLAEVVKHALLVQSPLRTLLEEERQAILDRDLEVLQQLVADALTVKADIVAEDFLEQGIRAHLNLGHTFGHALESVTGFDRFMHGEAVAWGIDKALRTGVRLGVTDEGYAREVAELLTAYGFRLENLPGSATRIVEAMRQDKKKRGGRVRYILQRNWADTFVTEIDDETVLSVLKQ